MRKILVIQQVDIEGLGTFEPALDRAGFHIHTIKVHEGEKIPKTASGCKALIVLGGPMGVYEEDKYPFIAQELGLIKSALKEKIPVLGICLGAQLIARAAGARVYNGGKKEIGWYGLRVSGSGSGDRLLAGLPGDLTVFQWHGDTFDVPPGGANLASSDLFPNQLIKVGANAYGVQFHLEITEAMIGEWITANQEELKAEPRIDPEKIKKESAEHITALYGYSRAFISRFIRLIDR